MASTRAQFRWRGGFKSGSGTIVSSASGELNGIGMSWAARTGEHHASNPEELLAGAHAGCFSMALTHDLEEAGFPPSTLDVTATVTFEQVDGKWTITRSVLDVVGNVPGIDEPVFHRIAEHVKDACPMSRAIHGNVAIDLHASLESAPDERTARV